MDRSEIKNRLGSGYGPEFEIADLPDPPRDLSATKLFAMLGPAVIALGAPSAVGNGWWDRRFS